MARRQSITVQNTTARALAVSGIALIPPGQSYTGACSPQIEALLAAGALARIDEPPESSLVPPPSEEAE